MQGEHERKRHQNEERGRGSQREYFLGNDEREHPEKERREKNRLGLLLGKG